MISSLDQLKQSIDNYEREPNDDAAQMINLESLWPALHCLMMLSDQPTEVITLCKKGSDVLLKANPPSRLTQHYGKHLEWKANLLEARLKHDHERVRTLLQLETH
ncbi:hypothetical protein A3C37_02325 [Candidatus Peribacteria bacterium RIFCSPHIGHO2_02_FULL_53_20]|nr:MAG: hypothetical protein A3C37_02325 [Candidatus Peribacteria bacterium RIFCSPHIGHO2_02_FULL_53_20]OGJ65891.1 MAG: hypothetical protein A3B61_03970 [Candidatus Peribacteria bacterium RIFCSPLOWO2_01_FULL_53_10]OGJ69861.1 MAG: hypothetical protein A3G69_00290 [Candidatus Peribacteria bacterium RIFCSPLOWO2_12_FULL_53_10]